QRDWGTALRLPPWRGSLAFPQYCSTKGLLGVLLRAATLSPRMFRWKEVEGTKKELSGLVDSEIGPSEAARTFFNRLIIQLGFQRNQRLQYDRCCPCQPYCPPRRHCLGRGHGPRRERALEMDLPRHR